jgi:hypothetical protein
MLPDPLPKPQSPFEQWLRAAHSSEWFEVIERHESTGWSSIRKPFTTEGLIKHFFNPSFVSGIRPEKLVRYGVADIDCKPDSVSSYWHKFAKSPELIELERRTEQIGCRVSFLRSSHSGGLHAFTAFPEAIPAWMAHWLLAWLLDASGMALAAGQAEVFPSRIDYRTDGQRARSNGFRLPGQEGSALIVAETFYEGADTIYGQLLDDIESTEFCKEWKRAVNKAKEFRFLQKRREAGGNEKVVAPVIDIEWTKGSSSNDILSAITTKVRLANRNVKCPIQLGEIIREVATAAKGFQEFASDATKKDLMREKGGWGERWARSSLGKHFCGMLASIKRDSNRNERLSNESKKKIKDFADKHPEAATWSKRKLAGSIGIARRTLEKHWDYWLSLPVHTPTNNGGGQLKPTAAPEIKGKNIAGLNLLLTSKRTLQNMMDSIDSIFDFFTEEELDSIDLGVPGDGFLQDHDRSRPKLSLACDFST